jgi:hypothetical protein
METSPLPVKGCKFSAYARRSGPLSREGSLSCDTCCDTGPRFFRSYPKDRPIQSPLTTRWGCRGPILTRILKGLFSSRTTGPEKLIFTWQLSDIIQNQVFVFCFFLNHGPRGWVGATIGEFDFTCSYTGNVFKDLLPKNQWAQIYTKVKTSYKRKFVKIKSSCLGDGWGHNTRKRFIFWKPLNFPPLNCIYMYSCSLCQGNVGHDRRSEVASSPLNRMSPIILKTVEIPTLTPYIFLCQAASNGMQVMTTHGGPVPS